MEVFVACRGNGEKMEKLERGGGARGVGVAADAWCFSGWGDVWVG